MPIKDLSYKSAQTCDTVGLVSETSSIQYNVFPWHPLSVKERLVKDFSP